MEKTIEKNINGAIRELYGSDVDESDIQIQATRKEFEGDITAVVFPLIKYSGKTPEETATDIGNYILEDNPGVIAFNVVKGFLNLQVSKRAWLDEFVKMRSEESGYSFSETGKEQTTLIEYSSPNTNKPLHLGHIRNNLLGYSLSRIYMHAAIRFIKQI